MVDEERTMARARKIDNVIPLNVSNETDDQVEDRIAERFDILEMLADSCIAGNSRALIVSGPAGLGKSYTVEKKLEAWDPNGRNYAITKGYVRATGLVKLLYAYREAGQVLVFDDADAIFFDDISLNLLKAVCDTTERRVVSWLSEGKLLDEDTGELVPRSFVFEGSIIFISNYDFDAMIDRGHKLAPHLQAMVSRAHYLDLAMKTRRDYLVRIRQVVAQGLLSHLDIDEQVDVLTFIEAYADSLRELSLRMALKVASIRKTNNNGNWEKVCKVTCCK
jgi:hypothetical protein